MRGLLALSAVFVVLLGTTTSSLCCALRGGGSPASSPSTFLAPLNVYPVPLYDRYQLESVIEVAIGTPPQKVHLMFDTGSFRPVVFNKSCTSYDCGKGQKYDSSASSSASIDFSQRIPEDYGAGNCSGYDGYDLFRITTSSSSTSDGESSMPWNQSFAAIDTVSWGAYQDLSLLKTMDGIFGIGPYTPEFPRTTSKSLAQNFGIDIIAVRMPRGQPFSSGMVQFGGYDKLNPEQKEPVWVDVTSGEGFIWFVIPVTDVLVNGKSTGVCKKMTMKEESKSAAAALENDGSAYNCQALMDTGGGTMEFANVKVPVVPVDVNCSNFDGLPDVTVVLGGANFTLEPQDYVIKVEGSCYSTLMSLSYASLGSKKSKVLGNTVATGFPRTFLDIGIQWMSRVTTIFDYKNLRVGFIQHR